MFHKIGSRFESQSLDQVFYQLTGGRSFHLEEWRLCEGRLDLVALVPPAFQGHEDVLLADGSEHLIDGLD